MTPPAVELRGVGKRYAKVEALRDASITVAPGTFLVLLGPSGSGKTTLLRCLAGIERPSSGEVLIGGATVSDGRRHLAPDKRDLGMVFQDFALWPHMTVAENVAFPLRRLRLGRPELGQRTKAMLEKVGLGAFADRYPHELSGGQQQRVALARALVARPRVLLFDEPLSALDANLRERLRLEIATLVREHGATAIYITHDQSEAFALGDEIAVLQDGEIVQRGAPEAIYGTPATPFVARFTGLSGTLEGRLLDAPVSVPGTVRVLLPTTGTRPIELAATALVPLPAGAAVQVLLRPTAPRICRPGTAAARLRAVVVERAYHGRGYDYVLALGEGLTLAGVFDRRPLQRGAAVAVYVDPAGALVFAADAARPVPPLAAPDAAPGAPPDVAGSWLMPTAEDRR